MVKKICYTCIIIIILLCVTIFIGVKISNYNKHNEAKNKVINYVSEKYKNNVQLIKVKKGNAGWMGDIVSDEFIFYDKNNDMNFSVFIYNDDIYDDYNGTYNW